MHAQTLAKGAYGRPDTSLRSLRGLEYDLLARSTSALRAGDADFPALAQAIDQNIRLWSVLAADLADPENSLPSELKARLFYLFEFTLHHSRNVLEGKASAAVLVDINTAVMRGLRGGAGA